MGVANQEAVKHLKLLIDAVEDFLDTQESWVFLLSPSVFVGLSAFDKASVNYYVQSHIQMNEYSDCVVFPSATKRYGKYFGTCINQTTKLDMTGLRLSTKLMTVVSSIDDLYYPKKTDTYYIVNVPYIFSACWKVVKPLLQERSRRKVQVLQRVR